MFVSKDLLLNNYLGLIRHYWDFIPIEDENSICTLLEGNTPLISSTYFGPSLGLRLYFKYEGLNPTGSFKDRGMTVAVSKVIEEGARAIMCASTGNTSASAAAYAAKGGLNCYILVPEGKIARGKLAQAMVHGAKVVAIKGNFDDALRIVREITTKFPIKLVNSLNPFRLEGQKTASFEICDQLGRAPEYLCIPVGNAGNITAYWMGFSEYYERHKIDSRPRLLGIQAEGAAPIVRGEIVEKPETIATAIRIGNPARWKEALKAVEESEGHMEMVSDQEIIQAYQLLAQKEGLFVEPASAASVAGLIKMVRTGWVEKGALVVCVLTGHGLKDPDVAIDVSGLIMECGPTMEQVIERLGL